MPHRLLIEFVIEYQSQFSPFLKAREAVRGEEFTLNLSATNLGDSRFPGADVEKLSVEYRPHGALQSAWSSRSENVQCPKIEPRQRVRFFSEVATALDEGMAWIHVKMQPKDRETVEYYQTPHDPLKGGDEWVDWFYVVSREGIQIIALLDQLTKRLK